MGIFSLIASTVSSDAKDEESNEALRKQHGFEGFEAELERLKKYSSKEEMKKAKKSNDDKK